MSQFAIAKNRRGGRKNLPFVFTQEGVAMLSGVLNSPRAVQADIAIMRGFVQLRQALSLHEELASRLSQLEGRVGGHDDNIKAIFAVIRRLMDPPPKPRKKIGFSTLRAT